MDFEWDRAKDEINQSKHDVAFAEAVTIFGDPLEVTIADLTTLKASCAS